MRTSGIKTLRDPPVAIPVSPRTTPRLSAKQEKELQKQREKEEAIRKKEEEKRKKVLLLIFAVNLCSGRGKEGKRGTKTNGRRS